MLTNNYDILNTVFGIGGIGSSIFVDFSDIGSIKSTRGISYSNASFAGSLMSEYFNSPFLYGLDYTNSSMNNCLMTYLGSGTTEPTKEDYTMQNVIRNINVIKNNSNYKIEYSAGKIKKTLTLNVLCQNTTDSPLTISEFGIAQFVKIYNQNYDQQFLLYRETFEPITMPASGAFTFEKSITIEGNS